MYFLLITSKSCIPYPFLILCCYLVIHTGNHFAFYTNYSIYMSHSHTQKIPHYSFIVHIGLTYTRLNHWHDICIKKTWAFKYGLRTPFYKLDQVVDENPNRSRTKHLLTSRIHDTLVKSDNLFDLHKHEIFQCYTLNIIIILILGNVCVSNIYKTTTWIERRHEVENLH